MIRSKRDDMPSNRLYSGNVTDFRLAMQLVIAKCEQEKRSCEHYNASLGPDEQYYLLDTSAFDEYADAAKRALAIYDEQMRKAEEAALVAMIKLAADDQDMQTIAEALGSGDYARLAI